MNLGCGDKEQCMPKMDTGSVPSRKGFRLSLTIRMNPVLAYAVAPGRSGWFEIESTVGGAMGVAVERDVEITAALLSGAQRRG